MNKLKKLLIGGIAFCLLVSMIPFAKNAKSKTRSYYSGDAISYNNKLIFGSANMSATEIFALENNRISKKITLRSFRNIYSKNENFHDLLFNIEDGRLFAYMVDGRYIYKYDITDLSNPFLANQIKDNSWDWFYGLTKTPNGYIATVGYNGIKIWNDNMVVIDSFNIKNPLARNVAFSQGMDFIFSVGKGKVDIYDINARRVVKSIDIDIKDEHLRQIVNIPSENVLVIADDNNVVKMNFFGKIIDSFKYTSTMGYDVVKGSGDHIYFTDGEGVVKSKISGLNAVKWFYSRDSMIAESWAMGLEVVKVNDDDKVVMFNNSNICVLDGNLKLIDTYQTKEESTFPIEQLGLSVDKIRAATNSQVLVSGKGYGLNEDIVISLANKYFYAKTDETGKFSLIITVPDVNPTRTDIKADGKQSKLTYSIGFQIE